MPPPEETPPEQLEHVVVRRLPSSEYDAEVEGKDDMRVRAADPVKALQGIRKLLRKKKEQEGERPSR